MMIRKEFEKTLITPDCVTFWLSKTKEEVSDLLGEVVAKMVEFDQCNPHHCYDLFAHTVHTVENVRKRLLSSFKDNILLLVAAFFHDIGKVHTAKAKEGRLFFYGHAKHSEKIARVILHQMGYVSDEIEEICFYISHHDDFISYVLPEEKYNRSNPYLIEITPENVQKHKNSVESTFYSDCSWRWQEVWFNLIILCYADADAQNQKVYSGDKLIDSNQHKISKIAAIESIFASMYQGC